MLSEFNSLIVFTNKWPYKCLVTDESITSLPYLTSLTFSLIFEYFFAMSTINNCIILMPIIIIMANQLNILSMSEATNFKSLG